MLITVTTQKTTKSQYRISVSQSLHFWERYYRDLIRETVSDASPFAIFACNFIDPDALVIDLGCGNGRDSRFLGQFNDLVGIDQSGAAIEYCNSQPLFEIKKAKKIIFHNLTIEDAKIFEIFKAKLRKSSYQKIFIYARFFLHAIDETQYDKFWEFAHWLNLEYSVAIGVEFRTKEDEKNFKVFPDHFRRFLDPSSVVADANLRGFKVFSLQQGYGLAKYRNEDPHVARIVFG